MKKLFLLIIPFLFILTAKAYIFEEKNFIYDETTNVIQNVEKIPIEKNTTYYFTFCRMYEDYNYVDELKKAGITNNQLVIRTDSLNERYTFKSEITSFGTVSYVKIVNTNDSYIYYLSTPATKEMYEKRNEYFSLIKEEEFNKLNIHYNDMYEETIKDDFDGIYYVDYDNLKTVQEIANNLKATDNNDGVIENIEITYDEYSNKSQIGDYYVEFKCLDSSNNESKYRLLVKIVDITKPVISLKTHSKRIELNNKQKLSYNDLLDFVEANDNTCDMNGRVRILSNDYFRNESKPGEYKITYYASDLYGNVNKADLIIGVGYGEVKYKIEKFKSDNLSSNDACVQYFNFLNINPKYEITLDNYKGNEIAPGKYEIGVSYDDNGKLKYDIIEISVLEDVINSKADNATNSKFNFLWLLLIIPVIVLIGIVILIKVRINKKKW